MTIFANGSHVSDIQQLSAKMLSKAIRELEAEHERVFWESVEEAQRTLPENERVKAYCEIVRRIGLPSSMRLRPLDTRGYADRATKRPVGAC